MYNQQQLDLQYRDMMQQRHFDKIRQQRIKEVLLVAYVTVSAIITLIALAKEVL